MTRRGLMGFGVLFAVTVTVAGAPCSVHAEPSPGEYPRENRPFAGVEVGTRRILSTRIDGVDVEEDPGLTLPLPTGFFTGLERNVWGPFSLLGLFRVTHQSVDWAFARGRSMERFDLTVGPGLYFKDSRPWVRFRLHFPVGPAWMTGRTWEARLVRQTLRPRTGFTGGVIGGIDILLGTPDEFTNSLFLEAGGHVRSFPYRLESTLISGSSSDTVRESYVAYDIYWYLASGYAMHF